MLRHLFLLPVFLMLTACLHGTQPGGEDALPPGEQATPADAGEIRPASVPSPPPPQTVRPAPKPEVACGVSLTQSREALAERYYVKGDRLYNADEVQAAKSALKTAICLDPNHKQARDLLDLLTRVYP